MALRSEDEGFVVVGLPVFGCAEAVAYCRNHRLCGVGALLWCARVFVLVLRLRWVCVRARGARQRH